MPGNTKLADQKGIEWRAEGLGDLGRDRDASARQPKHQDVGLIGIASEVPGELATGVAAVTEW